MNYTESDALLPEGLRDELPPNAAKESQLIMMLEGTFESYGYLRVKPPLIEFEETLLSDAGSALAGQAFRVMDPLTQRMMAVRSDMTPQIARIARTRLANQLRPLRLCYTGQVLRVRGDGLRPERQFTQAGIELIGSHSVAADQEVLCAVVDALKSAGVGRLTVDLTSPNLVPVICAAHGMTAEDIAIARKTANGKDISLFPGDWPEALRVLLTALIRCAGPIDSALSRLAALDLPEQALKTRHDLTTLARAFTAQHKDVGLTLDPGESRGFEYQTGLGFTLFALGVRGELGRGGRYRIHDQEPAVGGSLYLDTILRALPALPRRKRVLVPHDANLSVHQKLKADDYATIRFLGDGQVNTELARAQNCEFVWIDGDLIATE